MKKSIFFIILSLAVSQLFAQSLDINEEFNNNDWKWSEYNSEELKAKVDGGRYKITNQFRNGNGMFFWKDINIDEQNDFVIEAKIRDIASGENRVCLVWDTESWGNSNLFCFTGDQRYSLAEYKNQKFNSVSSWIKNENVVNKSMQFNILKIKKEFWQLKFYINDSLVHTQDFEDFRGRKTGFYVAGNTAAEVEYLKVYHYGNAKMNLIAKPINGYKKENLGATVNGKESERGPVISPDGNSLYFTKLGYPFSTGGEFDSDIYLSKRNERGNYSPAVNIGAPLNNAGHNSVISVSSDNQSLILLNTYKKDGTPGKSGLSITHKTENGWEMPKEIKIEKFYNDYESVNFCMSADNSVLIMSVQRNDSKGDLDLYVSFRNDDSTYTKPQNMGSVLNTKYQEATPFLAADNKTLYFSSNGHPGYGNNDIFVSERLDSTWVNWSEPQNLGPEINTENWDAYFTVPASGDYAYMVSSDPSISLGKEDIIRIKLPESARPKPIMLVKGTVINSKTNEPIPGSEIIYEDPENGKIIGRASSDKTDGTYQITLPSQRKYGFQAEKEGFYAVSDYLDLTELGVYGEVTRDLYMKPIEKNETIRLNNIFFDTDKTNLRAESNAELNRLVAFLNKNPNIKVKIEGHTDNVGAEAYNQRLSEGRAESVVNYLIENGIDESRLSFEGFGMKTPVDSNETEEGRQNNRRVEFRIIDK